LTFVGGGLFITIGAYGDVVSPVLQLPTGTT